MGSPRRSGPAGAWQGPSGAHRLAGPWPRHSQEGLPLEEERSSSPGQGESVGEPGVKVTRGGVVSCWRPELRRRAPDEHVWVAVAAAWRPQ